VDLLASLTDGGALEWVAGGLLDKAEIDFAAQTVRISGRDLSAPLIDTLTNDQFINQTSSQVAAQFAADHNLQTAITPTSAQVGRLLNDETGYATEDISKYRLLSYLAQQEGFDFFVSGNTLYFGPPLVDSGPLIVNYSYAGQRGGAIRSNALRITCRHDKTLAANVTLQVNSWSYQDKAPILSTYTAQKAALPLKPASVAQARPTMTYTRAQRQGGVGHTGPFYIVRRSGLTQEQADTLAQEELAKITSNEREVEVSGPGILGIDPRRTMTLTGTETPFDQNYAIRDIERIFSWTGGCTMTITAKSSSAQEMNRL